METDATTPLISIIIPAYNVESYIEETILSVKNQTLSNWELIVVDDGSTDNTYSVICKAVESIQQNVTILQQENRGQSAARNAGMEKASGVYIYFLDSDDRLTKNALSVLYTLAKQYELDAVFFSATAFADDLQAAGNEKATKKRIIEYERYCDRGVENLQISSGREAFTAMVNNNNYIPSVPFTLYKHSLLEDKHFVDGILFEDNPFTMEILLDSKRVGIINEKLYERRIRADSIMQLGVFDYVKRFESRFIISEVLCKKLVSIQDDDTLYSALEKLYREFVRMSIEDYQILLDKKIEDCIHLNEYNLSRIGITQFQVWYNDLITDLHRQIGLLQKEKEIAETQSNEAKVELSRIKKTYTYRVGLKITAIPRWLRRKFK